MEEIVQFVPMEKELMKLKDVSLVSDPKKVLSLTPTAKLLYRYMLDRYQHFSRLDKKFFDNQEDIAKALGVTSRTVLNNIKDMVEFGLIEKNATKTVGAAHSNAYVVHDIFDKSMFNTGSSGGKILSKYEPKKPVFVQQKPLVKPIQPVPRYIEEDPDVPF